MNFRLLRMLSCWALCRRAILSLAAVLLVAGSGCVTRADADAKARDAFLAGQQQAMERMRQTLGPSVTVTGPVQRSVIPWTDELTLAKAIVEAGYLPAQPPGDIYVVRNGAATHVDAAKLLGGEDFPLESGDIVQLVGPQQPK